MQSSKFTKIDEEFVCENCGRVVPKLGYTCRNHCPYCLYSKHLDINPGDRAETCHGILEPIGLEISPKKGYVIIFKCKKCGEIIESMSRHDFKFCKCGAVAVDGGKDYLRRIGSKDDYEELIEYEGNDDDEE